MGNALVPVVVTVALWDLFPIETNLKISNETKTKLKEIRIESISDANFETIILSNPNDETTSRFLIRRVDHDYVLRVNLFFANGRKDTFELNQAYAANRAESCEFKHTLYSHKITYKKEDDRTIKVTIAHTQEELDDDLAKELINDALSKVQQKRFKKALRKLEEAQKLTSNPRIQKKIRKEFARVLNFQGLDEESLGFNFENRNMSEAAASKFYNAEECFQGAQNYSARSEYKKNLKRVRCKTNGNDAINEGNELIEQFLNQINEHINDHCYALALKDCDLALEKCKLAEEFFRDGANNCNDDRFEPSFQFVRDTREEIKRIKMEINLKKCNAEKTGRNISSKKKTKHSEYHKQI